MPLELVGADRDGAQRAVSSATPSSIRAVSRRSRRCSANGTREPSAVFRAARRTSVSSISASSLVGRFQRGDRRLPAAAGALAAPFVDHGAAGRGD
jgi:hypothetical protein